MRSPATIERNGVLIVRDNYANPLFPAALAAMGCTVIANSVSSPGGLAVGIGLTALALFGFIRSTVILDHSDQTVTVRRTLLGIGRARRYALRSVQGVETSWTKFGDTLLMRIADGRTIRRLRIAGPSRTDLAPLRDEVRRYIARA